MYPSAPNTSTRPTAGHHSSNDALPDRGREQRFHELLEVLALAGVQPPVNFVVPETPALSEKEPPVSPSDVTHSANPANPANPANQSSAAPSLELNDLQSLTLRVSTGPLAGLIVQAHCPPGRLTLRFVAPSGALAQRLKREQASLSTILTRMLGVNVTVGVDHDL